MKKKKPKPRRRPIVVRFGHWPLGARHVRDGGTVQEGSAEPTPDSQKAWRGSEWDRTGGKHG